MSETKTVREAMGFKAGQAVAIRNSDASLEGHRIKLIWDHECEGPNRYQFLMESNRSIDSAHKLISLEERLERERKANPIIDLLAREIECLRYSTGNIL